MTLVELVVAMSILGVVLLVFTSVLASVQRGVVRQDNLSRTLDSARLAIQQLDRELRSGNVLAESPLSSSSTLLRYTAGAAIRISDAVRLKTSVEYYQFSDLADDVAFHVGVATPF